MTITVEVRLFSKHNYLINNCLLSAIMVKAMLPGGGRGIEKLEQAGRKTAKSERQRRRKGKEIEVVVSHVQPHRGKE